MIQLISSTILRHYTQVVIVMDEAEDEKESLCTRAEVYNPCASTPKGNKKTLRKKNYFVCKTHDNTSKSEWKQDI